jgi:methionyl-tRNA formyltransferase
MAHENAFLLFRDTVEKILSGNELETMPQQEGNYYSLPELEKCKDIGENESIEDIDRKIRAFWNPPYSGAKIEIKGKKYTVINEEILHWIDEKLKNNSQNGGDIDEKLHTIQQFEDFPSYGKY